MSSTPARPLLTLEPLIEAVREGVEAEAWELSGLQKTTSHQFEGRWAGESTRSAYLFFHRPAGPDWASVEAFLDEATDHLEGNLALVVDARRLGALGDPVSALGALGALAADAFPVGLKVPVSLRLRLDDRHQPVGDASTEIRFKIRVPRSALAAGAPAVTALCTAAAGDFSRLLDHPGLAPFVP